MDLIILTNEFVAAGAVARIVCDLRHQDLFFTEKDKITYSAQLMEYQKKRKKN